MDLVGKHSFSTTFLIQKRIKLVISLKT